MAGIPSPENRSSSPVLTSIEAITKAVAPMAVIAALGSGLVIWQQHAVLTARVEHLESHAGKGERFTAHDGARLEARVGALEIWKDDHVKFGWEKTLDLNSKLNEIERRCERGCK